MKQSRQESGRVRIGSIFCFVLSILLFSGSTAYALFGGKITEYTADQVFIDANGSIVGTSRLYMTPDKMRMDGTPGGMRGQDISVIYLKGEKRHFILNTKEKLYFEGSLDGEKLMQGMSFMKNIESEKVLGTDKVSGFKCTKKQIESTVDLMGYKKKRKYLVWMADELEAPIRTKMDDGSMTELRNIKKGAPDNKRFQVPKGYRKVSNIMELMGMNLSETRGKRTDIRNKKPHAPRSSAQAPAGAATPPRTKARPAPVRPAKVPAPAGGLIFPNSDFETGTLMNWTASGTAFQSQPTKGDNPTARGRRGQPSRHQGAFWVGTFEQYTGAPGERPGRRQGDRPTGTLTSVPFQINGERISFLVGGGKGLKDTYVALVVKGREVRRATGNNTETMRRVVWDVRGFVGQEGTIIIRDAANRGWGHLNADDFRYKGR